MNLMLIGAIAMACFTASLFFLRFWRKTGDRFFLFFSLSFCIEGVSRVILGMIGDSDERQPLIVLMRLFAFVVILIAIIDKNRKTAKGRKAMIVGLCTNQLDERFYGSEANFGLKSEL